VAQAIALDPDPRSRPCRPRSSLYNAAPAHPTHCHLNTDPFSLGPTPPTPHPRPRLERPSRPPRTLPPQSAGLVCPRARVLESVWVPSRGVFDAPPPAAPPDARGPKVQSGKGLCQGLCWVPSPGLSQTNMGCSPSSPLFHPLWTGDASSLPPPPPGMNWLFMRPYQRQTAAHCTLPIWEQGGGAEAGEECEEVGVRNARAPGSICHSFLVRRPPDHPCSPITPDHADDPELTVTEPDVKRFAGRESRDLVSAFRPAPPPGPRKELFVVEVEDTDPLGGHGVLSVRGVSHLHQVRKEKKLGAGGRPQRPSQRRTLTAAVEALSGSGSCPRGGRCSPLTSPSSFEYE